MNNSPRKRADTKTSHSIAFHPVIWGWLVELANREYDNNVSLAVTALVVYDRGVRNAKRLEGKEHRHHVTKGLENHDALDAAIREIEGLEPGFSARTWLEITKEEAAKRGHES